jgi:hypothetical protein
LPPPGTACNAAVHRSAACYHFRCPPRFEEAIVRNVPYILLLSPWLLLSPALASADTYKCVVNGETIYSQVRCGDNAETVKAKEALSGVGRPSGGTAARVSASDGPANNQGASAPPATRHSGTPGVEEEQADCKARMAAYKESQACFGRYRINANVMDPEAFKNCKVVPEPTDCLAEGM